MKRCENTRGRFERMVAEIDTQLVGYHLQQLRLKQGLTQEEAAEMFDYTPKQWARYERGETLIPLALLMTLRKAWGIPSIDDFLFVEDYDAGKAREKIPPSKDRR